MTQVQWPGQSEAQARAVARELDLRGIKREFYHPRQSLISGVTSAELELLANLARLGDWLAEDMLRDILNDEPQQGRESILLERLHDATADAAVAFYSWLHKFSCAPISIQHSDERVLAMLARTNADASAPVPKLGPQTSPDVARDLLVIASDGPGMQSLANSLLVSDPLLASDLFYNAGHLVECWAEAIRSIFE